MPADSMETEISSLSGMSSRCLAIFPFRLALLKLVAFLVLLVGLMVGCGREEQVTDGEVALGEEAQVERGISQELAALRARVLDDVAYELFLELTPLQEAVAGSCVVSFDLAENVSALALDFDQGRVTRCTRDAAGAGAGTSGAASAVEVALIAVHDHLVIPGEHLVPGRNRFSIEFAGIPVGRGGTALSRYLDESDGSEYLYTLFVPADAHRLFPCFDQPDLKARLRLSLSLPATWTAVANAPLESEEPALAGGADALDAAGRKKLCFQETAPLSTYLMAFAAGPFVRIAKPTAAANDAPGTVSAASTGGATPATTTGALYVRRSKKDTVDSATLVSLHDSALAWLEDYFGMPYPFDKLDVVLAPGFPYGGMEHAGAIFYRETVMAFDQVPTAAQLQRRAILIYHEVAHQWFGDLVTMSWFDDLWLKEGFATFLSYKILESLDPHALAWLRFHQRIKPRAYRVDSTTGTTPVYQVLDNLDNAKSAYGAIVYNKAPALLRQLEFLVGEEAFRAGTRLCLERYAFGNTRWPGVFDCYEQAAGCELDRWLDAWLLTAGMPVVVPRWERSSDGRIERFVLEQSAARDDVARRTNRGGGGGGGGAAGAEDEGPLWPIKTEVLLWYGDGRTAVQAVELTQARQELPAFRGLEAPEFLLVNHGDRAYGRFLLDPASLKSVTTRLPELSDPFLENLLLSALWNMVREVSFAPVDYCELVLPELAVENDSITFQILLQRLGLALNSYLGEEQERSLRPRLEALLLARIEDEATPGPLRLAGFRGLVGLARTEVSLVWLRRILTGEVAPKEIPLTSRDRWQIVGRLAEVGAADATALYEQEKEKGGVDVARHLFVERAAFPDPAVKEEYFQAYLTETDWPEQWLESSLYGFNAPGQSALTLPYLRRALDRLEWVKSHRKIFYMPRWIDAFIGGQHAPEALEVVKGFLAERDDLPHDIRLKVLQSLDGLERTVRIRARYAR